MGRVHLERGRQDVRCIRQRICAIGCTVVGVQHGGTAKSARHYGKLKDKPAAHIFKSLNRAIPEELRTQEFGDMDKWEYQMHLSMP